MSAVIENYRWGCFKLRSDPIGIQSDQMGQSTKTELRVIVGSAR